MVKDAKNHKFDVVIVWKIDRFARNMMDQFHYERELKLAGVTLESCKENISGGTIEADMNKGMLAIFAQLRSQQSAVDTMRGMMGKARQCQYLGVKKFGYSHDGDIITLDPVWAPVAEQAHYDFLGSVPIKDIFGYLRELGAKTSQDADPGYHFVRNMLLDESYGGVYTWGQLKDERGRVIKDATGKPVPAVRVEGGMPAIVSMEIKQACIDRIRTYRRGKARTEYPLCGKLYWRDTGLLMHGESGLSKTGRTYYYYAWRDEQKRRHSVQKGLLENKVVQGVREVLHDEMLVRDLARRFVAYLAEGDVRPAIKAAQDELKALEKLKQNLVNAVADGMPYEGVRSKFEETERDIEKIQNRIKNLEGETAEASEEDVVRFFQSIVAGDTNDERILRYFVNKVVFYEENVLAVLNFRGCTTDQCEITVAMQDIVQKENSRPDLGVPSINDGVGGGI